MNILVYSGTVFLGEVITAGYFYHVSAEAERFLCIIGIISSIKLHIAYNVTVRQLYYPVRVLLRELPVVRYDDNQLFLRQLFERIENLTSGI